MAPSISVGVGGRANVLPRFRGESRDVFPTYESQDTASTLAYRRPGDCPGRCAAWPSSRHCDRLAASCPDQRVGRPGFHDRTLDQDGLVGECRTNPSSNGHRTVASSSLEPGRADSGKQMRSDWGQRAARSSIVCRSATSRQRDSAVVHRVEMPSVAIRCGSYAGVMPRLRYTFVALCHTVGFKGRQTSFQPVCRSRDLGRRRLRTEDLSTFCASMRCDGVRALAARSCLGVRANSASRLLLGDRKFWQSSVHPIPAILRRM